MIVMLRRALVVALTLSVLGVTAGCRSKTKDDPKVTGTPDPRIQRPGARPAPVGVGKPGDTKGTTKGSFSAN